MITHRTIGLQGRLGNQMFQYASTVGIAIKNNYNYCFDFSNTKIKNYFNITSDECKTILIDNSISIISKDQTEYTAQDMWEEGDSTKFNPNLFNNPDYVSYHSYLQSYKYFEHCTELIRDQFSFKQSYTEIDHLFNQYDFTAIHVRRTDYLNHTKYFNILSMDWYNKAVEYILKFEKNTKFMIFGDDKSWCKNNFLQDNCVVSPFETEIEDLYAMTLCKNHIISNSTFAWWGSWLSKESKITIAPKIWFGPEGPQSWNDIYIKNWLIF